MLLMGWMDGLAIYSIADGVGGDVRGGEGHWPMGG